MSDVGVLLAGSPVLAQVSHSESFVTQRRWQRELFTAFSYQDSQDGTGRRPSGPGLGSNTLENWNHLLEYPVPGEKVAKFAKFAKFGGGATYFSTPCIFSADTSPLSRTSRGALFYCYRHAAKIRRSIEAHGAEINISNLTQCWA